MRFSRFLLPFVAVAPIALAAPDPNPNPAPKPNPVAAPAPASSSGLLSALGDIEGLLTKENMDDLQTIITGAAKVLSSKNVDTLQDILTNAHALLTKDFVDNTTTLIGDATPVSISSHRLDSIGRETDVRSWWRMCRNCWAECWGRYEGTSG